jgi:hypothetical protein
MTQTKKRTAHARGLALASPCVNLFFMGQALSLAYLAHNDWPHSFFLPFILIFFNYYFLYVFLKLILAFMF